MILATISPWPTWSRALTQRSASHERRETRMAETDPAGVRRDDRRGGGSARRAAEAKTCAEEDLDRALLTQLSYCRRHEAWPLGDRPWRFVRDRQHRRRRSC